MKSMYASRSVPVLNTPAPNAAYVDDSSSQNESLQRKADMANGAVQRVVQRETGVVQRVDDFPIDQFVYKDAVNNDLKFEEGHIVFTEYDPNLVSSGFTGCMMMAFKFNQSYTCKNFAGGTITVGTDNQSYIAHVFCHSAVEKDTKKALVDAEQQNLISIEALFKPFVPEDGIKISDSIMKNKEYGAHYSEDRSADKLKGRLTLNDLGQWEADVLANDDIAYEALRKRYKGCNETKKTLKHFNSDELRAQTIVSKALLYASLGSYDMMKEVLEKKYSEEESLKVPLLRKELDDKLFKTFLKACSESLLNQIKDNGELENQYINIIDEEIKKR